MTSSSTSHRGRSAYRLRKLPARYAGLVMPLILSCLMTLIVSAISTVTAVGIGPDLLNAWSRAWALSWFVAFPILLVILPLVRRLVSVLVETPAR